MTTFTRYSLFQIPGWIAAGAALYLLRRWLGLDDWIAWLLFGLYVAKDFLLYPVLKRSYEARWKPGPAHLIGERGTAVEDIAPEGYVRVRGEMWMAEAAAGASIPAEARVRVQAVRGKMLVVALEGPVD
ncbi:MAG TPA: NfeD family protein [Bryobacteraceae bacterium]|nr:NfeD family protein [Bryobacteraceae bacterium]